jgi:protein SCO1
LEALNIAIAMSDQSESTPPRIAPWTIWIPIIFIAMGVVVFQNWLADQALKTKDKRPPLMRRLDIYPADLHERAGKTVTLNDQRGKVLLLSHVYTTCPVGCSAIIAAMKDVFDEFAPKHPELQFVSFAIDPNDNPERLKAYADANDIATDNWWFVNGDQKHIRAFLNKVVGFNEVKEKEKPTQTSEFDKFEHDMRIALVDHQGHVRGMYNLVSPDADTRDIDLKRLRAALRYVLDEYQKEPKAK